MCYIDWITAAGSLVAASGASIAAWHAVKLLRLEKKREAERRRAKLVATLEREHVIGQNGPAWQYRLRVRNYGEAEAQQIKIEVLSIEAKDEVNTDNTKDQLQQRLDEQWRVRLLGPGGWFDVGPLKTYAATIELRLYWRDPSGLFGEYHTQLYQGEAPVR